MHTAEITSTPAAARYYLTAGWQPVPVPKGQKRCVLHDWPNLRLTTEQIPAYFGDEGNVALLLGAPSGGLTDIDLDAPEASAAAEAFLPRTSMAHGHESKPRSHLWYVANPIVRTQQFVAPDGKMIIEIRSTGCQTIVPPSIHPSGEKIRWEDFGEPAKIDGIQLRRGVALSASAALLARNWPKSGSRHKAALAAAGVLLRGGLPQEATGKLITMAAMIAGDEEWQRRQQDVKTTAERLSQRERTTGIPSFTTVFENGTKVLERLSVWLKLGDTRRPQEWEPPEPFVDQAGPPFPVNAFPEPVRSFVVSQSASLQVPSDMVASLVLGVGAAACAGRGIIRLNEEWCEPLNLFVVVALPSGERKSPAFRAVSAPLEEREQSLVEAYRLEVETHESERDILQARLLAAKSEAARAKTEEARSEKTELVVALAKELSNFRVLKSPRLLADDATPESVMSLLSEHSGRIAVMSTEGGLFETLAGRYSDGVANIDVYLKGYSGDPLRVDRKSRRSEYVRQPALTLCLTVQPSVITDLFSRQLFRSRGLLARFLYAIPKSMVGFRTINAPPVPPESRKIWRELVMNILKLPNFEQSELTLTLSDEARLMFDSFRDRAERRLRPESDLSGITDWGNKFPGVVARIAGILQLFQEVGLGGGRSTEIGGRVVEAAIQIGEYYAEHALVAYAIMGADPDIEVAKRLWAVISHDGISSFSVRDFYAKKRHSFTRDDLEKGLALLGKMGYVRSTSSNIPSGKPGRPPSPTYEVNPLACDQNSQNSRNRNPTSVFDNSVNSVHAREEIGENREDTGEV